MWRSPKANSGRQNKNKKNNLQMSKNAIAPIKDFSRFARSASVICKLSCNGNHQKLEERLAKGETLSWKELQTLRPNAFTRLQKFAGSTNPEIYLLPHNVEGYLLHGHNEIIDEKRLGYEDKNGQNDKTREACKTYAAEVTKYKEIKSKNKRHNQARYSVTVLYKCQIRRLTSFIKPKKGRFVLAHYNEVIRNLTKKEHQEYFS